MGSVVYQGIHPTVITSPTSRPEANPRRGFIKIEAGNGVVDFSCYSRGHYESGLAEVSMTTGEGAKVLANASRTTNCYSSASAGSGNKEFKSLILKFCTQKSFARGYFC